MLEKYIKRSFHAENSQQSESYNGTSTKRTPITEVQNTMKHFSRDTTYRYWKNWTRIKLSNVHSDLSRFVAKGVKRQLLDKKVDMFGRSLLQIIEHLQKNINMTKATFV